MTSSNTVWKFEKFSKILREINLESLKTLYFDNYRGWCEFRFHVKFPHSVEQGWRRFLRDKKAKKIYYRVLLLTILLTSLAIELESTLYFLKKSLVVILMPILLKFSCQQQRFLYDEWLKRCTVWKFHNFTITQILREINFGVF